MSVVGEINEKCHFQSFSIHNVFADPFLLPQKLKSLFKEI